MRLDPFPIAMLTNDQQVIKSSGVFENVVWKFLQFLWNRTGQGDGIVPSVNDTVVAAGTTQGTGTVLEDDWNFVSSNPGQTACVIPEVQQGQTILVYNLGPSALNVFPSPGWAIDFLGPNNSYNLANHKMQMFYCQNTDTLKSTQLG